VYSDSSTAQALGRFAAGEQVTQEIRMRLMLATGTYHAQVGITAGDLKTRLDRSRPLPFYVSGRDTVHGVVDLDASFVTRRPDDYLLAP
jgi:hypothetical protein